MGLLIVNYVIQEFFSFCRYCHCLIFVIGNFDKCILQIQILLIPGILQAIHLKGFTKTSKVSVHSVISVPVAYTKMLSNAILHGQIAVQS